MSTYKMNWTTDDFMALDKKMEDSQQPPKEIKYMIWMEGFSATEQHQKARLLGESYGLTWKDAVEKFMVTHPDIKIERGGPTGYNIWGCCLFEKEEDARKEHG